MRRSVAAAGMVALLTPAVASAQAADPRFRVSINGGMQASNNTVSQSFTVEKNLEAATIAVNADEKRAVLIDLGIVSRIRGPFGVGFAVSYATQTRDADITASIPHPFFFNQPRTITGGTSFHRSETAGHIEVVVHVPGRVIDLELSGGPSVFNVQQTLVTDVSHGDVYPYDTATFGGADKAKAKTTAAGFNAGFDVTWRFSRRVGLGGLVRLARASKEVTVAHNPPVTIDMGGLQLGAGLRIPF